MENTAAEKLVNLIVMLPVNKTSFNHEDLLQGLLDGVSDDSCPFYFLQRQIINSFLDFREKEKHRWDWKNIYTFICFVYGMTFLINTLWFSKKTKQSTATKMFLIEPLMSLIHGQS